MIGAMQLSDDHVIYTTPEVEAALTAGSLTPWIAQAYEEFRAKVVDAAFPCTFGIIAQRKGDVLFSFIDPRDATTECTLLHRILCKYTDFLRPLAPVAASLRPLAILMPPLGLTEFEYFAHSWSLLEWLTEHDTHPWPARVSRDPDDAAWSFCFGGMPLFINFKTPVHHRRRSRRMAGAYALLVQARDGFDAVAGDTPNGRRAREVIRRKLAEYDSVPLYPALAHYGRADNREWKQYFVPESNTPLTERCPLHPRSKMPLDQ
jgi:FPC/CPF motif-containing protein YcgG